MADKDITVYIPGELGGTVNIDIHQQEILDKIDDTSHGVVNAVNNYAGFLFDEMSDKIDDNTSYLHDTIASVGTQIDSLNLDITNVVQESVSAVSEQLTATTDKLSQNLNELNGAIENFNDTVTDNFSDVMTGITSSQEAVILNVKDENLETRNQIDSRIQNSTNVITKDIEATQLKLDGKIEQSTNFITDFVDGVKDSIQERIQAVQDFIGGAFSTVTEFLGELFQKLFDFFMMLYQDLKAYIDSKLTIDMDDVMNFIGQTIEQTNQYGSAFKARFGGK